MYKNMKEICSPHLSASFGTVCVQISQSFEAERSELLKNNLETNSFKCLKTNLASIDWSIWTQKVPKEA